MKKKIPISERRKKSEKGGRAALVKAKAFRA